MLKKSVILGLFIFYSPIIISQIVYEPIQNSVYDFLDHLSVKGIIDLHNEVKPYSRMNIAELLKEAESKEPEMTSLEISNLEFYKQEYYDELKTVNHETNNTVRTEILTSGETGRFRFFDYHDSLFSIYADPILGFSAERFHSSAITHFWNGVALSGYISTFLGFSLNFMDNQEKGNYLDVNRNFTPLGGIDYVASTYQGYNQQNSLQFDEVNADITASWNWGSLTIAKDYLNWGNSLSPNGQLILSSKAPSFPFVELRINPAKWFRFIYIHGWLDSGIEDSSTIQISAATGRENSLQTPKFIAAHLLSVDITNNLTLSLGESVVYSERIEPIYLIPVMFFLLAEHYQKLNGSTGDNSQLFADASIKIPTIRTKFYSTLFIDELSFTAILESKTGPSAVGFTFGSEVVDPIVKNSSFIIEYTRLNPFVYENSNLAQTYTNNGYQLGNWIGSNGDIWYLKYSQGFLRGLNMDIWTDFVQKGSLEAPIQQYELPYPNFLFGLRNTVTEFGLNLNYELLHSLIFKIYYTHSHITDQDITRTPSYLLGNNNTLGLSFSYGL